MVSDFRKTFLLAVLALVAWMGSKTEPDKLTVFALLAAGAGLVFLWRVLVGIFEKIPD